jgi:hypothetical protein
VPLDAEGLTTTWFVDSSTPIPPDEQIGSAVAPFETIAQAAAASNAAGGGVIKITPNAYPAEAIVLSGAPTTVSALSLPGGNGIDLSAVTFTSDSDLAFENLTGLGAVTTDGNARFVLTTVGGAIECTDLTATESSLRGGATTSGNATLLYTNVETALEVNGALVATGTPTIHSLPADTTVGGSTTLFGYVTAGLSVQDLDARFCTITGTSVFSEADFRECLLPNGTFGNGGESIQVSMDLATYSEFVDNAIAVDGTLILTRNDLPPNHENLSVNGSAPISFTLLPAPHPAGTYLWNLYFVKKVAGTGGNLAAVLNYTDTSGAAALTRPNASLISTGHFNLSPFPIYSTGSSPITVDITFPGITGTPDIDIYNSLVQVG